MMKMSDFKFNFESKDQGLMDDLKHLQINHSDDVFKQRSSDEFQKLKSILFTKKPNSILDIGAGIGRSSVYFKNVAKLDDTKFYLADFSGKDFDKSKPCGQHSNAKPIPYNDLDLTRSFCKNNGMDMSNVNIIDLETNELDKVGKVDIIYSFHCIGYHWSIEEAFKKYKMDEHSTDDTILVFGGRKSENIKKYPEKLGDFKRVNDISGNYLQRFLVYKK
jgi:hypothetical protein